MAGNFECGNEPSGSIKCGEASQEGLCCVQLVNDLKCIIEISSRVFRGFRDLCSSDDIAFPHKLRT